MILDFIEGFELFDNDEDSLFDAQMTLAHLSQGLFWLYDSVNKTEQYVRHKAEKDNTNICIVGGILSDIPADRLSCIFQWYAVSVCNYARLVGWLTTKDKNLTDKYVWSVLPKVTKFRNKVAAHFAYTDPRNDNTADLIASVNTNIVYAYGYLRAGAISEIVSDDESNDLGASNKISWSLTKTHEKLVQRFWPSGPLESFQSIKLSAGATRKFRIDCED